VLSGVIALAVATIAVASLGSLIVLAATFMLPSMQGTDADVVLVGLVLSIFAIVFTIVFRDMLCRLSGG
jgi:hypothetical protein